MEAKEKEERRGKCRVVQKKNAQSFVYRHFATVFNKITQFSPKCSEMKWQHEEWVTFQYCD